jgi:hypothetical protein
MSAGAQTALLDPLHGYCAVGCIDNGINSPTSQNPPADFGFTISPAPLGIGDLLVDILTPDNVAAGPAFGITGTASGTATLVAGSPWTAGPLDTFLGISASPANPIGAFLPSTQALDPGATGFDVYQVDLGVLLLLGASTPNVTPLENIISGILPKGSYIVGFLNEGDGWIATANSGAIFETGGPSPPVPEPATFALMGLGFMGLGFARWRRRTARV